jgi:hypothetical protein
MISHAREGGKKKDRFSKRGSEAIATLRQSVTLRGKSATLSL